MARPRTVGKKRGYEPKVYTFRGLTGTIKDIYAAFPWQIGLSTLRLRIRNGMSLETAYNTPAYDWQHKIATEIFERYRDGLTPKPYKPQHQFKRKNRGHEPKLYTFQDVTAPLRDLHARFKWDALMSLSALRWRLRQGLTLEQAITLPTWDWQRKNADLATKKLEWYRNGQTTKPHKPRKPAHPADVLTAHCGVCQSCGAVLLKQSLHNGQCKGGC